MLAFCRHSSSIFWCVSLPEPAELFFKPGIWSSGTDVTGDKNLNLVMFLRAVLMLTILCNTDKRSGPIDGHVHIEATSLESSGDSPITTGSSLWNTTLPSSWGLLSSSSPSLDWHLGNIDLLFVWKFCLFFSVQRVWPFGVFLCYCTSPEALNLNYWLEQLSKNVWST